MKTVVLTLLAVLVIELLAVAYVLRGKDVIVVRDGEAYFVLPAAIAEQCRSADVCTLFWRSARPQF